MTSAPPFLSVGTQPGPHWYTQQDAEDVLLGFAFGRKQINWKQTQRVRNSPQRALRSTSGPTWRLIVFPLHPRASRSSI